MVWFLNWVLVLQFIGSGEGPPASHAACSRSAEAALAVSAKTAEGAPEAVCILNRSPIAYRFYLYSCGFAPPDKHVIAPDSDLQGSPEESPPNDSPFGPFGKAHVGQPFTDFLAD
jgi:hypothetical protein